MTFVLRTMYVIRSLTNRITFLKIMNKTSITVRLDSSVLQEIDSRCSDTLCRSDFIKKAISNELEGKNEPVPEVKVTKISYDDGKTWIDVD